MNNLGDYFASQMKELANQNELILDAIGQGIFGLDREGKTTFVNPAALELIGYTHEEMIGKSQHDLIHHSHSDGSTYAADICPIYDALHKGAVRSVSGEVFWRKDGTFFPVEYVSTPIFYQGEITGAVITFQDITERKEAEEAILNSELKFRSVVESAHDAIILTDGELNIMSWNHGAERIFGYSKDDALGKTIDFIIPQSFKTAHRLGVERFQQTGKLQHTGKLLELHGLRSDGTEFPLELSLNHWQTKQGYFLSAIIRDVSERKRTHDLLVRSEKLSVAGELAAGVAHEIRNPLTAVKGFLKLLKQDAKPKDPYFDIISSEIGRIESIVNELLLLAKPQAAKTQPMDIQTIIPEVISLFKTQNLLQNTEITALLDAPASIIIGDPDQIKQVFVNFIKNALDAVDHGGQVLVTTENRTADTLNIRIVDKGCGIPKDILQKLGEPFYSTKEKGTGLGIMVSKKVIENHQGTLMIDSEINKGTCIDIQFPLFK